MKVSMRQAYKEDEMDKCVEDVTNFIKENWERINRWEPIYHKNLVSLELN